MRSVSVYQSCLLPYAHSSSQPFMLVGLYVLPLCHVCALFATQTVPDSRETPCQKYTVSSVLGRTRKIQTDIERVFTNEGL